MSVKEDRLMDAQKGYALTNHINSDDMLVTIETCCLCGSKLRFTHRTDYLNLQVHEEANCPQCGIKNKVASFILQ
jgi:hypothetical protein